jgi:glycosyltransferase involved in cell wall biosynthesis
MKVLFTTPILEHPAAGGPQLRIENTIKILSRHFDLHIITTYNAGYPVSDETLSFFSSYCKTICRLSDWRGKRFWRSSFIWVLIGKIFNRILPMQAWSDAKEIKNFLQRNEIDFIWFGFGNISYPLIRAVRLQFPEAHIISDTDSVWSRFVLRKIPYVGLLHKLSLAIEGKLKEREEKRSVELSDVTTAVSEIDAEYYRGISSDKSKIHVFSNVIDLSCYEGVCEESTNPTLFIGGSFGDTTSAMNIGTRWFIQEVFPLIQARVKGVHLYVVGRGSELEFGGLNNSAITVTGKVPSVLPYLMCARAAIVPLKFESGTRFKILEAGACHVPIVSTTLGAEGIPVADGEHLLIADSAEDFAEKVSVLIEDPSLSERLARNCYNLVRDNYSLEALEKEFMKIIFYSKQRIERKSTAKN